MSTLQFDIEILEQGWLGTEQTEYDICSHGKIKLVIGGQVISSGEDNYGISESALALLRTLKSNHDEMNPVADRLIFHGCGTLLMMGCPIGINWNVTHTQGQVILSNVIRFDTTNEEHSTKFPDLEIKISEEEYRIKVIAFAMKAKQPFQESQRVFYDNFDKQQYRTFWEEYDVLIREDDHLP